MNKKIIVSIVFLMNIFSPAIAMQEDGPAIFILTKLVDSVLREKDEAEKRGDFKEAKRLGELLDKTFGNSKAKL